MKGFILKIRKAKNEDVIVTVLSKNRVESYYRFYGARHSILQVGNLIDFKLQESKKGFMPQIRKISHISFPWISYSVRLSIWQNFIKLFEPHLKEVIHIDRFYFELLLKIAKKWHKQNSKRLAIEAYIEILEYERRLHKNEFCYICENLLNKQVRLMRAYIPTHPKCINGNSYEKNQIFELFETKSTINIDDNIIDELFNILLKGF